MAQDHRFYIRAGAHTLPAGHFLVEAIRAQRALTKPRLVARLRRKPEDISHIELTVIALNDAPAIQVHIDIENTERLFDARATLRSNLPLRIGVIDRAHPFSMDYDLLPYLDEPREGDNAPTIRLSYRDVVGDEYEERFPLEVLRSIGALQLGTPPMKRIVKALGDISEHLATLVSRSAT
jgi:hypothetical protein